MAKVTSRDGVSLKFQRKILLFWRRVPRVVSDDWLEFRSERGGCPTLSNTLPGLADKRGARPVCVCIRHFPNAAPSKIPGRAPQTQKKKKRALCCCPSLLFPRRFLRSLAPLLLLLLTQKLVLDVSFGLVQMSKCINFIVLIIHSPSINS